MALPQTPEARRRAMEIIKRDLDRETLGRVVAGIWAPTREDRPPPLSWEQLTPSTQECFMQIGETIRDLTLTNAMNERIEAAVDRGQSTEISG